MLEAEKAAKSSEEIKAAALHSFWHEGQALQSAGKETCSGRRDTFIEKQIHPPFTLVTRMYFPALRLCNHCLPDADMWKCELVSFTCTVFLNLLLGTACHRLSVFMLPQRTKHHPKLCPAIQEINAEEFPVKSGFGFLNPESDFREEEPRWSEKAIMCFYWSWGTVCSPCKFE